MWGDYAGMSGGLFRVTRELLGQKSAEMRFFPANQKLIVGYSRKGIFTLRCREAVSSFTFYVRERKTAGIRWELPTELRFLVKNLFCGCTTATPVDV